MYFPDNMTFQYFFFDTYPGYFLEALPIAVLVAAIWYVLRYRNDKATPTSQRVWGCLFVCYVTGLACLVLFLNVMRSAWYALLYRRSSGIELRLFGGAIDLGLDFYRHINSEVVGNFLMFFPFGVLYPLSHPHSTFGKTLLAGFGAVAVMEVLQPVFGRALDLNDVVINALGVTVSSAAFFLVKSAVCNRSSAV